MKEQDKNCRKKPNEIKISNSFDKEFNGHKSCSLNQGEEWMNIMRTLTKEQKI